MGYSRKMDFRRKAGLAAAGFILFMGIILFLWVGEDDRAASARLYEHVYQENKNTMSVFKNVLLMDCKKNSGEFKLQFLWNGITFSYISDTDLSVYNGEIADIYTASGYISKVGLKRERIYGKVLSVSDDFLEIEGYGKYEFTDSFQMYSVVDDPVSLVKQEILLGYDNQEFVLEDGKICAAITIKEFQPEKIRVLIKTTNYSSIYHENAVISCSEDYIVDCGDSEILVNGGESIRINKDSMYFADGYISVYPVDEGEIFLSSVSRAVGTPSYEGIIELHPYEEGIVVINEVGLEDYLTRVVPSEMPPAYGLEAAKVQAVCARSFAYRQISKANAEFGRYSQFGAHVDDSISYQVYNNSGENEVSTRAVYETAGEVMAYQGSVIGTYYFSTSCGMTTDTGIWNDNPGAAPYLTSQEVSLESAQNPGISEDTVDYQNEDIFRQFIMSKDDNALEAEFTWYRWSITVDIQELSRRINEKLPQCIESNPSQILVRQQDGSFTSVSISSIGQVIGMTVLSRGSGGVVSQLLIEGTDATIVVLKQGNIRLLLGDTGQIYSNGLSNTTSGQNQLPSAFFCLEEVYTDDIVTGYTIYGGGNGHGVGMSQNGAKKMVEAGMSYKDVLEYFYNGALLSKVTDLKD